MHIIELNNISKKYNDFLAVDKVSFKIRKGEIFSIIGPNGAGKTTILKIICGLLKQTEGEIRVDNHLSDELEKKRIIGYMPEESALYENMSVADYLAFFAELYDVPKQAARQKTGELLKFLNLENKLIASLSKGMKRKVLLARSLINDPEILVYDEPASGLDPVIARNLLDHILRLKEKGKTLVMSAHDLSQIEEVSDTLLILSEGRIDILGSVSEIKAKYGKNEYTLTYKDGTTKVFSGKKDMLSQINRSKRPVVGLQEKERTLQEIFIDKFKNG